MLTPIIDCVLPPLNQRVRLVSAAGDRAVVLDCRTGAFSNVPLEQLRAVTIDPVRDALKEFVRDVGCTGGIGRGVDGEEAPLASPEWTALAPTYRNACRALGLPPVVEADDGDEDVNDEPNDAEVP